MPARATDVAGLTTLAALAAGAFAALPMSPASASPRAAVSTRPMAGVVSPKPPIRLQTGRSFIPILGDWEGTANGFPASFYLRYDPSLPHRRAVPRYGIDQLVVFRPDGCPVNRARYRETLITSRIPSEIGRYGSLGLSPFGYGGSLTKRSAGTLSAPYRLASCSGTQIWHMHPATRAQVDDGSWRLRFPDGESGTFNVQAGGRLANSIGLPRLLDACNGAQGAVDLFISANGRAQLSNANVRIAMRFSRKTAAGQLNAAGSGCPHGPIHFSAKIR